MNSEKFCTWLQGFVELTNGQMPTKEQWKSITEHLGLVFEKITPPVGDSKDPKDKKKAKPADSDPQTLEDFIKKMQIDYDRTRPVTVPYIWDTKVYC